MREDYASDLILLQDLEKAKSGLQSFYDTNYANKSSTSKQAEDAPTASTSTRYQPPKAVNFTARYEKKQQVVNELEEYLNLRREDYKSCRPLKWWVGRRAQFPNLWRLVRDIFSIPGKLMMHGDYSTSLTLGLHYRLCCCC